VEIEASEALPGNREKLIGRLKVFLPGSTRLNKLKNDKQCRKMSEYNSIYGIDPPRFLVYNVDVHVPVQAYF